VKSVFESARNKCGAAYTSAINVKNIKSNKILKEKHGVILGNVYFCIYKKPRKRVKSRLTKPRKRVKSSTLKARNRATITKSESYET